MVRRGIEAASGASMIEAVEVVEAMEEFEVALVVASEMEGGGCTRGTTAVVGSVGDCGAAAMVEAEMEVDVEVEAE